MAELNRGETQPYSESNDEEVKKKKQPPFWEREIKIKNSENVDQKIILTQLQSRFRLGFNKWRKQAKFFKAANFSISILIILLQVSQVIVFQIPALESEVKTALATILPAITGAVLALQLKLAWSEKGTKCKKSARLYKKLFNHVDYRLHMMEAGGQFTDTPKLWNSALVNEIQEVPAFLSAY